MMTEIGSGLESEQGMLLRQIRADNQDGFRFIDVVNGGQGVVLARQRVKKRSQITGAVMIDILGLKALSREFGEEKVLFVGRMIRTNHAEFLVAELRQSKALRYNHQSFGPGNRLVTLLRSHHGRLQALRVLGEVERVAPLHA